MAALQNQRHSPRYIRTDKLYAQVTSAVFHPEAEGATLPGQAVEISKRGLRIQTSDSIPVGCMVDLWIEVEGLKGKFYLNSEVKWSRLDHVKGYVMGVELREGIGSDIGHWERLFEKKRSTKPQRKSIDAWGNAI